MQTIQDHMQDQGLEMQGHCGQWKHRQSRLNRDGGEIGAGDNRSPESIQSIMVAEGTSGECH